MTHVPFTTSTASVACLAVPALPLACALADQPGLRDALLILADESGQRVAEVGAFTASTGVRRGMPLREAIAFCPQATVLEARPARVERRASALVEALEAVSPLVERAEPGVVFADLHGTETLFATPGSLERAIFQAAPAALDPRLGIAGQRFTAYVAAMHAEAGGTRRVDAGEEAAFLAPLAVDWLRDGGTGVDGASLERMRLLGLRTCGDLAVLPRHTVEAQFGPAGGRAWLAARGEDPTPLRPRVPPPERVVEQVQAEPPLVGRESVTLAVEQLLGRALRHPRAVQRAVRQVRLRAESERDGLWERTKTTTEPTADRHRLGLLLRSLIEYAEFPGPLVRLELELGGLTAESGRQRSLFDAEQMRRREQLDDMVRHLKVRFGCSPVARVVAVEPWHRLPERRYALLDYDP